MTQPGDLAATDPTAFPFTTGSADTWAFVFRRTDNTVRIYEARQPNGGHTRHHESARSV